MNERMGDDRELSDDERADAEAPSRPDGEGGPDRRAGGPGETRARERTADFFGYVEDAFYVAVSVALSLGGVVLFGYVVYDFVAHATEDPMSTLILELLDGLLLVFIITELIHTVRAVIDEKVLLAEPFLIVGIVAAIRRLIVVGAQAKELLGTPEFTDTLVEIAVLSVGVVLLSLAVFLFRKTTHSEPRPAHEPG
ncbi:MAG TPA: phosphate-starvation-inducible PsiE family protein [Actinomycetota bacterium]|nr:phosphate-starvation-inducible PsiE family protein [Actinomycetota bacterium]